MLTTRSMVSWVLFAGMAVPSIGMAAERAACESLTTAGLFSHTSITSARSIPADLSKSLPAYCEVTGSVTPVPGSKIGVVYRLPDSWNGKMLGLGGGGWAGNTTLAVATPGLVSGYATAQTNGGHDVDNVWDTSWASSPDAVTDFSYRAVHVMTDVGKAVVAKYYGRPQSRAYFQGCSTGGRQGLMEVQRFPNDYNGVVSGAPVYSLTTQTMSLVRNKTFAHADANLTEANLKYLNDAALAACDAADGLKDGIVTDPRQCKFDPALAQCKDGAAGTDCLSRSQVAAVRSLYTGVRTSQGVPVSYALTRGSEVGWSRFISTGAPPSSASYANGTAGAGLGGLRALIFKDPDFDLAAFNPDRDYWTIRSSAFAKEYEAANPDISAFVNAGGKLLLWHGFDDPGPSPLATLDYFHDVQKTTGPKVKSLDSSARLFLAPGVYHCRGGPGADQFDTVAALDQWVEKGEAPKQLLATRADGAFSRPLCLYPALPRYDGKGDPKLAESFVCK
ncbi:MAG: tannase/feruloyl esterase family alpha/beta hydrolase [Gammaproteobacteria bacterium]